MPYKRVFYKKIINKYYKKQCYKKITNPGRFYLVKYKTF